MLTDEQLAIRRTGIAGTDLPAILGMSPWKSPLMVALEKWGEAPAFVGNDDTDRGSYLEPGIRDWYAKRTGRPVAPGSTCVNAKNPLIIATPDGIVHPDDEALRRVLEIKCPRSSFGWGEEGTDEVPQHILVQGHWQMAATELPSVEFALFTEGQLRIYRAGRDPELEGRLIEAAERFWHNHVVPKKAPLASAPDLDWLRAKFPKQEHADYMEAPVSLGPLEDFLSARSLRTSAEKTEADAKARLQQIIGHAPGVRGSWGRIQWTQNKPSLRTDWKTAFLEFRNAIAIRASLDTPTADMRDLLADMDEAQQHHTTIEPGSRPFRVFLKGED